MKDQNLAIVFGEEELVRSQNILSNGVRAEKPGSTPHEPRELLAAGGRLTEFEGGLPCPLIGQHTLYRTW